MTPRTLRILFVATTPLLFAQFAFALWVVRPHPALLFPYFAGAPGTEGVLALERRSVQVSWQDGARTLLLAEELIPEVPDHTRTKVTKEAFPRSSFRAGAIDADHRAWLHERLKKLGPVPPAAAEIQLALRIHDAADGALLEERRVGAIRVDW